MPNNPPKKKRKLTSDQPSRKERPTKKARTGQAEPTALTATRCTSSTDRSKLQTSVSQPKQRNVTPGPSSLSSVAHPRSRKRKAESPSPSTDEDSDKTPPSSIIPLPKVAKLGPSRTAAKRKAIAKPKDSPKNHKIPVALRRAPARLLDSFSISSDSDDPIPSPPKSRPKPTKQRPVADPEDIIDLCSDDDQTPISTSPVRIRIEDDIFVILSTDDEMPSASAPALSGLDYRHSSRLISPVSSVVGEVLQSPLMAPSEYDTRTTAPMEPEPERIADASMSPSNYFQPEDPPLITEPVVPLQVVYNQALADSCDNDAGTQVLSPLYSAPRQSLNIIYSDTPSHPPIHTPLFFAKSVFKSAFRFLSVVNDELASPITDLPSSHPEPKEEEEGLTSSTSHVPLPPHEDNHVALDEENSSPSQTGDIYRQAYVEGLRLKEILAELRQSTAPLVAQESGEATTSHSGHVCQVTSDSPRPPQLCLPETNIALVKSSHPEIQVFDSGLTPLTTHTHLSGHYPKLPAAPLRSNTSPDSSISKDTSVSSLDSLEDSPGPSTPGPTHALQNITIGCFTDSTLEFDLDLDLVGKDIGDDDDDVSLSGLELVYPDAPLVS